MTQRESTTEPVISVRNLSVRYGSVTALKNVNLDVMSGDYLGVIGPNGGGKSTLIKAILGLVPAASGEIRIFGDPPDRVRVPIGYVPQFATMDRRFPVTVREVVQMGRIPRGLPMMQRYGPEDRQIAERQIERLGLLAVADRQIHALSGGQFQKMLLARALAREPRILLLDEPTANVDAGSRDQIFEILAALNKEMTIVMVTHDMMAISSSVRSLACVNGIMVRHGEPMLDEQTIHALYGCPVDLIAHGVPHRTLRKHEEDEP